jgi:NADH dehydrogenase
MSTTVIIAGAGFAGLAAAHDLARRTSRRTVTIRVLDAHPFTTMIPSLPDLAGGCFEKGYMMGDIQARLPAGVLFSRETIQALDFRTKQVITDQGTHPYDYLVVATGSVTDFHGFNQHRESLYKLDTLEDAGRLFRDFTTYVRARPNPVAVIAGGGYTGLELACNLRRAGRQAGRIPRILVAERGPTLLPFMPEWVRSYMTRLADETGIEVITGTTVTGFDGCTITLSNGQTLEDGFLCWTTGTRFPIADLRGNQAQLPDGRLVVDDTLRLPAHPEVFAAGDSAALMDRGKVLRKAVNFSRDSGFQAGRNVASALLNRPLRPFKPVDLGWVIPFCHAGVGVLFTGIPVRGRLPLMLHYAMCGLRNYSLRNRLFYWKVAVACLFRRR